MSFLEELDAALGAGICNWLNTGGNAVLGSAVVAGVMTPGAQVPSLAAGLGLLALNAGCAFDPDNGGQCDLFNGPCAEGTNWCARTPDYPTYGAWRNIVGTVAEWEWMGWLSDGTPEWRNRDTGQLFQATDYRKGIGTEIGYGSQGVTPVMCSTPCEHTYTPLPTVTYVSPTTSCSYDVTFKAWNVQDNGTVQPVVKIEPTPVQRSGAAPRTGGGIIQGCNFQPVVYFGPPSGGGGGGGTGTYIPWVDGPEDPPWWLPYATAALGGVIGAALDSLLEQAFQKQVAAKVYRLVSVCETDSQGEPISQSREVPIPDLPWDEALIYRLDAIEYLLQGLKDFKQPICSRSKPVGDFVTVHFESDAPSIAGERPLRKYLRYRDQMASDLAAHAAHWENFAWEAGPVIVIHKNAPWGIVKVWAADADEGKRVIRHAGTISGLNPDAEGEWLVTSSDDPRYGRTGTMRLGRRKSGQGMVLTISKRGGPDGLPIVPVDPLP